MATLHLDDQSLSVRFTTFEKVFGLVGDLVVPRGSVVGATFEPDALRAAPGMRAPGLGMPWVRKIGTWRGHGKTLVSVRRGQPAVAVRLRDERYARLLIGADDAQAYVDELNAARR